MPNKKKKIPITGYAIFVRETRDQYEKKGWHFPKNNQDAFTFVAPLWKKLSEEERTRYNNLAKHEKRQGASDLESKFNALGISQAEIEAEKREKDEFVNIMLNTIHNTVQQSDFNTTFKTQKFYLCHVNFFYVNSNDRFKPAEIALSEFNLKKGVVSRFHAFINPGSVETGYRFEAKRKLEESHQIPIEDPEWNCGERDYVKLFYEIKNFLCKDNPNGRIPPIYTMPDDEKNNFSISAVRSTIETLCEACNEEPSEFKIYELPQLYHEFRLKAVTDSPISNCSIDAKQYTLSMALQDLERDKFCYTKGIACQFHEEKDIGNFCSMSVVTRLVYTMCDFLLNYLPDEMIQGGHIPKNSILAKEVYHKDDDGFEVVRPLRKPNLSQTKNSNSSLNSSVAPPSRSNVQPPSSTTLQTKPSQPMTQVNSYASATRPTASQPIFESSAFPAIESTMPLRQPQSNYAGALRANTASKPGQQPAPPIPTQLRFTSPRKLAFNKVDDDSYETSSSVYEDAVSNLTQSNLSQTTTLSGYAASASLTQSSFDSDVSSDAIRYLGRGRGIIRSQEASIGNINWALNAGRGSRPRGTNTRQN